MALDFENTIEFEQKLKDKGNPKEAFEKAREDVIMKKKIKRMVKEEESKKQNKQMFEELGIQWIR